MVPEKLPRQSSTAGIGVVREFYSGLEPKPGGPRCQLPVTSDGSKARLSITATKLVTGCRSEETAGTCGCATLLRVAIGEPYGQWEELARRPEMSSVDIPDMPEVPDMQ
jgi:hypothetical protein